MALDDTKVYIHEGNDYMIGLVDMEDRAWLRSYLHDACER